MPRVAKQTVAEDRIKPYEFRRLQAPDLFLIVRVISKLGLKRFKGLLNDDDTQSFISGITAGKEDREETHNVVGVALALDIAQIILEGLNVCEHDIYQLLSNVSNLSYEQVIELDIGDFAEMVMDFVMKEEFADFFTRASKLLK